MISKLKKKADWCIPSIYIKSNVKQNMATLGMEWGLWDLLYDRKTIVCVYCCVCLMFLSIVHVCYFVILLILMCCFNCISGLCEAFLFFLTVIFLYFLFLIIIYIPVHTWYSHLVLGDLNRECELDTVCREDA